MLRSIIQTIGSNQWGIIPQGNEEFTFTRQGYEEEDEEEEEEDVDYDIREKWLQSTFEKIYLMHLFNRWKTKVIRSTENFTKSQKYKIDQRYLKKFFWVWKNITRPPLSSLRKKVNKFYDDSLNVLQGGSLVDNRLTSAGAWVVYKDFPGNWVISAQICEAKGLAKNRDGKCPICKKTIYMVDIRDVSFYPCGHIVHRKCCFERQKGVPMHVCRDFSVNISDLDSRNIHAGVSIQSQNMLLEKCPMMILDRTFLLIGPLGFYWRISVDNVTPGTRIIRVSDYAKNHQPDGHIWGAVRAATIWRRKNLHRKEIQSWALTCLTIRLISNAWNELAVDFNRFVNGVITFRGQKFISPKTYLKLENKIRDINSNMILLAGVMDKENSYREFLNIWEKLTEIIHSSDECLSEMFPPIREYRNGILLTLKNKACLFEKAFEQAMMNLYDLLATIQLRFENDRCSMLNGTHSQALWSTTFQTACFTFSLPIEANILINWIKNYREKYTIKYCDEKINMQWGNQSLYWSHDKKLIFVIPQICVSDLINNIYRVRMAHVDMEYTIQKLTAETKIPYDRWNEENRKK
jgi:hypothetical protein